LVKTPLVYTSVALRDWQAFDALKVDGVYAPGGYHTYFHLNPHVTIGGYQGRAHRRIPSWFTWCALLAKPGFRNMSKIAPAEPNFSSTSFETFERNIRDQLGPHLKDGGFDPARDITAITVNRWPHGYAPEYNPLFDPDVPRNNGRMYIGRARSAALPLPTPTPAAPHTRTRPSIKGIVQ
jgi:spermidine dehydrogenase